MAGNRGTQEDGTTSDPVHRGLFRERALAHYERWGGEPVASAPRRGGLARPWRIAGLLLGACLVLLAAFAWLVRVPLTEAVPAAVVSGASGMDSQVVAVLPATQAQRVRQGVTVQVTLSGHAVEVPVVLRGDGRVLSAAEVVALVPALASAGGLPARGVLATATAPASLAVRAGRSVLLTAWAVLGDQSLIRLARPVSLVLRGWMNAAL